VKGKTLNQADRDWKLTRIAHVEQKLGYCVVDVDGPKVKFTFKAETSPGVLSPPIRLSTACRVMERSAPRRHSRQIKVSVGFWGPQW